MQSEKIERLFVEFILKEIGPSEEKKKEKYKLSWFYENERRVSIYAKRVE